MINYTDMTEHNEERRKFLEHLSKLKAFMDKSKQEGREVKVEIKKPKKRK